MQFGFAKAADGVNQRSNYRPRVGYVPHYLSASLGLPESAGSRKPAKAVSELPRRNFV